MPAMPIAESSAPMVVGMRQTSRAMSTVTVTEVPAYTAKGWRVTTAKTKMMVSPARRMLRAISLGVFCRLALSTRPMIRSMKVSPGFWVISMTIRSESTRVPPVTELRSLPASRITGADSPVIADSSTEAMPSMMVPSLGMMSPASQTTMSPRRSSGAGTGSSLPPAPPFSRRAMVSLRVRRRVAACALPRPSATASAKLAKSTVNQSQRQTWPTKPLSCWRLKIPVRKA